MLVNRRTALKQFLFVSAGVALLPACMQHGPKSAILLKHFAISADQEKMLAELAETIIPGGSTPGAADISAHLFVLKMLDDCYSADQQQKFLKGLQQLEDACTAATDQGFTGAGPAQRTALLAGIEAKKATGGTPATDTPSEMAWSYGEMKRLTIQAYTTSRFFLTKVRIYELVPGRWHGCVPVKQELNKGS